MKRWYHEARNASDPCREVNSVSAMHMVHCSRDELRPLMNVSEDIKR